MARLAKKNKSKMYYSHYVESSVKYRLDDDGNKIYLYTDDDGVDWYEEEGTLAPHFDMPVEFRASISSQLDQLKIKAYGADQSAIHSQIVCEKGYLDLRLGDVIWKDSEIKYKDDGFPDQDSADYTVTGLDIEGKLTDWFLLQRRSINDK